MMMTFCYSLLDSCFDSATTIANLNAQHRVTISNLITKVKKKTKKLL